MDTLIIRKKSETPEVILDKKRGVFSFEGRSLPENPFTFYTPVLEWVDSYVANPNKRTELNFSMSYFNTSSSKILLDIMKRFECIIEKNNELIINWICSPEDEDMIESGEIYEERMEDIPFNIIIKDQNDE